MGSTWQPKVLLQFQEVWGQQNPAARLEPRGFEEEHLADEVDKSLNAQCREILATTIYSDGVTQLSFGFLPRAEVNAYAFRRDSEVYIAASFGCLTTLLKTAKSALATDTCSLLFKQMHGCTFNSEKLAYLVTIVGLNFLVAHETSHVSEGHLGYLTQRHSIRVLSENSPSFGEGEDHIDLQAMELQADLAAVRTCLRYVDDPAWRASVLEILELELPETDARGLCLSLLVVALAILLLLLQEGHRQQGIQSQTDHPAPHFRLLNAVARIGEIREVTHAGHARWFLGLLAVLNETAGEIDVTTLFNTNNRLFDDEPQRQRLTELMGRADALVPELAKHRWRKGRKSPMPL